VWLPEKVARENGPAGLGVLRAYLEFLFSPRPDFHQTVRFLIGLKLVKAKFRVQKSDDLFSDWRSGNAARGTPLFSGRLADHQKPGEVAKGATASVGGFSHLRPKAFCRPTS
jgi:hypothetical protein